MSVDPRTSLRPKPAAEAARHALADLFAEVRSATERLCEGLSPEDCGAQSMTEASPIQWHLAHTSWFFETFVLTPSVAGYRPFHPEFGYLFNSYYNAVGERVARSQRGKITRPSRTEVMSYRRHIDEHVRELFASGRDLDRGVLELGCHHEQQHQELMLTDLKHLLSLNPLRPVYRERKREPSGPIRQSMASLEFILREAGLHVIGHAGESFAFDNESPSHRVFVEAFELASRPVTNGEYLEFITDRGYERPEWWLSDGWDAVVSQGWRAPLYWEERDGVRHTFTLGGFCELDPAEPVCHVSYYEADAFARWSKARLPREAEWEIFARERPVEGNFVETGALHPSATSTEARRPSATSTVALRPSATPIGPLHPSATSTDGIGPQALFGDVWEWTQSAYSAYPGYRPVEGALGEYNGKFMVNQMVLRGGSCASPRSHLRATYRNFFPPAARWQFSGIRLARDL